MRFVPRLVRLSLTPDLSTLLIRRFRLLGWLAFALIIAGSTILPVSSNHRRTSTTGSSTGDYWMAFVRWARVTSADAPGSPADVQLNIHRHGHTATLLNDGTVLVTGGENQHGLVSEAELFDPTGNVFRVIRSLKNPRADHTATLLGDGRVLIIGGRGCDGPLNSTEIFDPAGGTFTDGPPLHHDRAGQTATTLTDGRILIAGGDAAGSIEIYDSQANSFTLVDTRLHDPRSFHSAAPFSLQVGDQRIEKVLVTGGSGPDGIPVKSGEIFDAGSSTFSLVNNELTDEHIGALLRVLPDSKVQIIGGSDHEVMEIYDPATNQFGGHVHVYPTGDDDLALVQEILDAPTRTAMFRLGAPSVLLDRKRQTITELTGLNLALVLGGVDANDNSLASASVLNSSPASVTTDKLDYAPGTPVIVSGAGWQPHEVVTIVFHEDPHKDTENRHTFSVQTDASGAFVCPEYAPEGQDAGLQYLLAANGVSSGWTAQTAFTDSSPGTLGNYATAGLSGATASISPSNVAANITFSNLARGPGLSAASATDAFNSSAWSTATTLSSASDDYYEFTINPSACFRFSASELRVGLLSSSSGPGKAELRSSLDSFGSPIASAVNVPQSGTLPTTFVFSLSSIAGLQNRSSGVTFRIYGYSAGSSTGTMRIQRVASPAMVGLEIDGTVAAFANSAPTVNSFIAGTASAPSSSIIDFINASMGDTLMLGATASDPDAACGDSVASYLWTVNGHSTATPANSLSIDWPVLQSIYGITSAGTYAISVTAKDTHDALSAAANGTLTVYQNVIVPNLIVGGAICSQPALFNAAASHNLDPRFTIASYTFDFGDGSPVYTETAGSFPDGAFDGATKHTYTHAGDYSARLTVIDSNSQSASTPVTVTVTIDDVAPLIETSGGPYVINLGDNLMLNGTADDANLACGDVLTFHWDLNNDGVFDYTGSTGTTAISAATLNALGVTGGEHTIKFQVTDTLNLTAMATTTLTVQAPPNIHGQPVSVSGVCSGSAASFSVTATGTSLMYQWRKGGIPLANGANISGADTAMLTINPAGAGDVGSYDVIVSGAVAPPATSISVTLSLENIDPTFSTPPVDRSANTDANCAALVPDFTLGVIAEDNCGTVTLSQSPVAGTPKTAGHYPVRVTATDGANNSSFFDVFFDVTDNTPPSAHAKDINVTLGIGGTATVIAQDINNGSTDNCGIVEYKIKKAADSSFADFVTFGCAEAGLEPVVLRVKDAAGTTSMSNSTVMVNQRPTILIYTGPSSAVYAANVTLSASLQDAASASALAGRVVTFTIGTQTVSATTNAFGIAAANLTLDNGQSTGSYTVQTSFAGDCTFTAGSDADSFAITPSCVTGINAVAEYIGTLFAWTTSPTSSTASLTLSAGLKACTGDVRTATVTFAIRNGGILSPIPGAANLPVGLVDPGNATEGTATAIVQYNIGSNAAMDLEIAVIVSGNFAQDDPSKDALVTIAKPPATNSILGGGEIDNLTDSRGYLRGADNEISQFFLNVTYNKKGSNPQGRVSVIVHSMNNPDGSAAASMRTYKISSTAISVLAAEAIKGAASFSSKATVQDITDPLNPIAIDGGATLQVEMKDAATDTISIYVLNKAGGVWFVNKLDAMLRAVQVPVIGTGNIVVK